MKVIVVQRHNEGKYDLNQKFVYTRLSSEREFLALDHDKARKIAPDGLPDQIFRITEVGHG